MTPRAASQILQVGRRRLFQCLANHIELSGSFLERSRLATLHQQHRQGSPATNVLRVLLQAGAEMELSLLSLP